MSRGGNQRMSLEKCANLSDCGTISACATDTRIQREYPVLLSMLSGEFCLILKLYLVVKISSDVVTEHCCQVCVLSMMFCRSDCRLCAGMCGKWLRNQKTPRSTTCFHNPTGQHGIWKILFMFDFHILPKQRHIGPRINPCRCISIKKDSRCWPIYQVEAQLKCLGAGYNWQPIITGCVPGKMASPKWRRSSSESERNLHENMLTTCLICNIKSVSDLQSVWALLELRLRQKSSGKWDEKSSHGM